MTDAKSHLWNKTIMSSGTNIPMIEEIKVAYKYMLLKLAIQFVDNGAVPNCIETTDVYEKNTVGEKLRIFNAVNNFSIQKTLLLPFLICVANGEDSKTQMLDFFNNNISEAPYTYFDSTDYGIVQTEIVDFIKSIYYKENDSDISFKYSVEGKIRGEIDTKAIIQFIEPKLLTSNLYDIDFEFQNSLIILWGNGNEHGKIRNDVLLRIFQVIDHCIKYIHENRYKTFVNQSERFLIAMSTNNRSYSKYYSLKKLPDFEYNYKKNFKENIYSEYFVLS